MQLHLIVSVMDTAVDNDQSSQILQNQGHCCSTVAACGVNQGNQSLCSIVNYFERVT